MSIMLESVQSLGSPRLLIAILVLLWVSKPLRDIVNELRLHRLSQKYPHAVVVRQTPNKGRSPGHQQKTQNDDWDAVAVVNDVINALILAIVRFNLEILAQIFQNVVSAFAGLLFLVASFISAKQNLGRNDSITDTNTRPETFVSRIPSNHSKQSPDPSFGALPHASMAERISSGIGRNSYFLSFDRKESEGLPGSTCLRGGSIQNDAQPVFQRRRLRPLSPSKRLRRIAIKSPVAAVVPPSNKAIPKVMQPPMLNHSKDSMLPTNPSNSRVPMVTSSHSDEVVKRQWKGEDMAGGDKKRRIANERVSLRGCTRRPMSRTRLTKRVRARREEIILDGMNRKRVKASIASAPQSVRPVREFQFGDTQQAANGSSFSASTSSTIILPTSKAASSFGKTESSGKSCHFSTQTTRASETQEAPSDFGTHVSRTVNTPVASNTPGETSTVEIPSDCGIAAPDSLGNSTPAERSNDAPTSSTQPTPQPLNFATVNDRHPSSVGNTPQSFQDDSCTTSVRCTPPGADSGVHPTSVQGTSRPLIYGANKNHPSTSAAGNVEPVASTNAGGFFENATISGLSSSQTYAAVSAPAIGTIPLVGATPLQSDLVHNGSTAAQSQTSTTDYSSNFPSTSTTTHPHPPVPQYRTNGILHTKATSQSMFHPSAAASIGAPTPTTNQPMGSTASMFDVSTSDATYSGAEPASSAGRTHHTGSSYNHFSGSNLTSAPLTSQAAATSLGEIPKTSIASFGGLTPEFAVSTGNSLGQKAPENPIFGIATNDQKENANPFASSYTSPGSSSAMPDISNFDEAANGIKTSLSNGAKPESYIGFGPQTPHNPFTPNTSVPSFGGGGIPPRVARTSGAFGSKLRTRSGVARRRL